MRLKQILDRVVKKWGYEYILVACGACLGLLIVTIVGFDDRPAPRLVSELHAARTRTIEIEREKMASFTGTPLGYQHRTAVPRVSSTVG